MMPSGGKGQGEDSEAGCREEHLSHSGLPGERRFPTSTQILALKCWPIQSQMHSACYVRWILVGSIIEQVQRYSTLLLPSKLHAPTDLQILVRNHQTLRKYQHSNYLELQLLCQHGQACFLLRNQHPPHIRCHHRQCSPIRDVSSAMHTRPQGGNNIPRLPPVALMLSDPFMRIFIRCMTGWTFPTARCR